VDRARAAAVTARDAAIDAERLAVYAQEALTSYITSLIRAADLDPNYQYRVDLDTGQIVAFRAIPKE
jgi:hypothetical protein